MAGTWRCTDNGLVLSHGVVKASSESPSVGAVTFIEGKPATIMVAFGGGQVIANCDNDLYVGNTVEGWTYLLTTTREEKREVDHVEDTKFPRFFRSKTFKMGYGLPVINIYRQGGKFCAKLYWVAQQIGENPYNVVKHLEPEVEHEGDSIEGLLKLLEETQFIELRYCQVYNEVFTTSGFVRHCRMNLPDRMICYGCGKHHSKHKQWKKCCGIRK